MKIYFGVNPWPWTWIPVIHFACKKRSHRRLVRLILYVMARWSAHSFGLNRACVSLLDQAGKNFVRL